MTKHSARFYEFGPFRLDVRERLLIMEGKPIPLAPKAFEVLVTLVRKHGRLVEKEELLKEVWPDTFVEESNLAQNVYLVRRALGKAGTEQKFVETVPQHGYRFVADVREVADGCEELIIHERTRAEILIEREPVEHCAEAGAASPARRQRSAAKYVYVATGIFAAALLLLSVLLAWQRAAPAPLKSVAVLPFKVVGSDEPDLIGLGMTDAVITKLSGLRRFAVFPTSTVSRYVGAAHDPLVAGRELGADAILDGTMQRHGGVVRVTLRLVRVADAKPLWAETFDEEAKKVFALQDVISERVADALELGVTTEERRRLASRPTRNVEAHQEYVRGVYFSNKRTAEALERSVRHFRLAIEKDPDYALAYAALADAYAVVAYYGFDKVLPRDEAYKRAKAAATKATELDSTIAEAHSAAALVHDLYESDPQKAEQGHRRALALNPDSSVVRFRYSVFLTFAGRLDEALGHARRAQELDPLSAPVNSNLASLHYFCRNYGEAVKYGERALEVEPEHLHALLIMGLAYEQMGRFDQAVAYLLRRYELQRGEPDLETLRSLGHAYALGGRASDARAMLRELERRLPAQVEATLSMALVHSALGEMDRTFELIGLRVPHWQSAPRLFDIDPRFEKIRSDPRYTTVVLNRVGQAP